MHKILCIGEALIDMICTDKGKTLAEGEHFLKKPGGAPANVAAAIGILGGSVELVAKVGTDPFGQHLLDTLQEYNVNTGRVYKDESVFTSFAYVSLLKNGERDFHFNRGADAELTTAETTAIRLDEFGIVHFGSATAFLPGPLQSAYLELLERSIQHKRFISFDPNYRQVLFPNDTQSFINQSWYFLERCDFFKVSDEEALLLCGSTSLKQAIHKFLEKTKAAFTITLGKKGAILGLNNQSHEVPGIEVNPVDTTGAGDAFAGAVLLQLSERANISSLSVDDWKRIVQNANIAGAKVCEHFGAMEAFKFLNKGIFRR
jgi:fructokinase